MTCSYDHSIKIWDARPAEEVQHVNHDHPIDSSLITPSGTILITAGGNEIKLWDLIMGGRLLHTFSNHQKNITCLALEGGGRRLLSVGLDGFLKIYSMQSLQISHGLRFGSPLLSVAMSESGNKLVVGYVDGTLVARTRNNSQSNPTGKSDAATKGSVRESRLSKGAGAGVLMTRGEDGLVETSRPARLRPYEMHLKKFQYQQALDAALATRNPVVIITVIEELCRRSGLTIALSGRDDVSLEPLLSFATRYINHPRYTSIIAQMAHRVLDLYGGVLGQSDAIDELFLRLHKQVQSELHFHKEIMRVSGSLDCILNSSSLGEGSDDVPAGLLMIPNVSVS